MADLVVTELAAGDIAAILLYLAREAGIATAERYARAFDTLYERLTDFPAIGSLRPSLGEDVRICIVSPYIVIYDYAPATNTVTILRVVHGRRNITLKLIGG